MTYERDVRRESHRAKRAHREAEAQRHGWNSSCLPLKATLGDILRAKAETDDEGVLMPLVLESE